MFEWIATCFQILKLFWHFRSVIWHRKCYFQKRENASHFVHLLKQKGPFFIKLGQWLGQRPDVVPPEFCSVLKTLQTDSPMHSWQHTLAKFENPDLLSHVSFQDYGVDGNPKPFSSGSIAQVYRVTVSGSTMQKWRNQTLGKSVWELDGIDPETQYSCILKVCHPNVSENFQNSLRALILMYNVMRNYCGSDSVMQLLDMREVATEMQQQCDLLIEAKNALKMRQNFQTNQFVHIPRVYCATETLLLEQAIEGALFYDQIGDPKYDKFDYHGDELARQHTRLLAKEITMAAFFQMMMVDGFVHGDCHSGNILYKLSVRDKKEYEEELKELKLHAIEGEPVHLSPCKIEVWFLDFGIAVSIDSEMRLAMLDLTISINANDPLLMVRAFERVLVNPESYSEELIHEFEHDCIETNKKLQECDHVGAGSSFQTQVSVVLENFRKHKLRIEPGALRIVIGWMLIDENSPIVGRCNNLPDNSMRWANHQDLDDNFQLHEISANIYAARASRQLGEHRLQQGDKNVVFVAPDLELMRKRTNHRRQDCLELYEATLQNVEEPKTDRKIVVKKTRKRRRQKSSTNQ